MNRRVVITGLGAITSVGEGTGALWQALLEGRSGIEPLTSMGEDWKVPGAVIKNFEPDKYIAQRKSIKVMARDIQLAMAASKIALDDSQANKDSQCRKRFGVVIGSGVLDHELDEILPALQNALDDQGRVDLDKFGLEGIPALFPLWLLKYLPNMPACHISVNFDLQGVNNTLTTGSASGLQAIGEAYRIIQRGSADVMLAGASESKTNPVGISQYGIQGGLLDFSRADENIEKSYKFFDENAAGFVVGEGAGFVVLEEYERAIQRNAYIYGEVIGFGSSSADGQKTAMETAIKDSGITKESISYIQATGLGLPKEDREEISAIKEVFGNQAKNIYVSGSKPVTGFTGFASGVLDFIIAATALKKSLIPPVKNMDEPLVDLTLKVPTITAVSKKMETILINAFGFNGPCACVVIKAI